MWSFSNERFAPSQGTSGSMCRRHSLVVWENNHWGEVLLASGGWRPGRRLNILQRVGEAHTTVFWPQMPAVLSWRNPALQFITPQPQAPDRAPQSCQHVAFRSPRTYSTEGLALWLLWGRTLHGRSVRRALEHGKMGVSLSLGKH